MRFTSPAVNTFGLYAVEWNRHFLHWLAWREWQHERFRAEFFPARLTTTSAWPPMDENAADVFAAWKADNRKKAMEEMVKERLGRGAPVLPPVPPHPLPWDEWPDRIKIAIAEEETNRRMTEGAGWSFAPRYAWNPVRNISRHGTIVYRREPTLSQDEIAGLRP